MSDCADHTPYQGRKNLSSGLALFKLGDVFLLKSRYLGGALSMRVFKHIGWKAAWDMRDGPGC